MDLPEKQSELFKVSISFGSLDFVGTVIHNANRVFYKLWKLRLCRDSNTQYTQRVL